MRKSIFAAVLALAVGMVPMAGASASTYGGTTVAPGDDGATYTVTAETGDTVTLSNIGSTGGQLAVTFDANVNGTIKVVESGTTRPASASSDAPGSVSTYYDVTLSGLTNDDISGAKWRFNVAKSWLTQQNVSSGNVFLHHFGGNAWERLTTREVASNDTSYTFEADVNDFSPFAVTAVEGLSNTGSPYMVGAVIAAGSLAALTGTLVLSRKRA